MRRWLPTNLRTRLTLWYVTVLAVLLIVYAILVFAFQYAIITRQIEHDEFQDVSAVEGLLFFDPQGTLHLRQDYYSRPQSHLLIDRLMEVRDQSDTVLYRSPTLHGMPLGGPLRPKEGEANLDVRLLHLQDGSRAFVISHIHVMQGRTLLIRLGYSIAPLWAYMVRFFLLLMVAIPIALLIAAAAGQAIAQKALSPLEKMTARAERITASNLHDRLEVINPKDELGHMAQVFNHLLDRLEQAFAQLQRFTADAAHELRTPLASLRTIGEVALGKGHDSDEYKEALGNILEETERLSATIDSLLILARAEVVQPGDDQTIFPVSHLVDEILNLFEVVLEERHIVVVQSGESIPTMEVSANRKLLRVAVLNVLHNAIKFSPDHSTLHITYTYTTADSSKPILCLEIQDEGSGIAQGEHQKIFERFFTSSSQATAIQSGTGLGLSVARLIIDRSGGNIYFDEKIKGGAKCIITLPLAKQTSAVEME